MTKKVIERLKNYQLEVDESRKKRFFYSVLLI